MGEHWPYFVDVRVNAKERAAGYVTRNSWDVGLMSEQHCDFQVPRVGEVEETPPDISLQNIAPLPLCSSEEVNNCWRSGVVGLQPRAFPSHLERLVLLFQAAQSLQVNAFENL